MTVCSGVTGRPVAPIPGSHDFWKEDTVAYWRALVRADPHKTQGLRASSASDERRMECSAKGSLPQSMHRELVRNKPGSSLSTLSGVSPTSATSVCPPDICSKRARASSGSSMASKLADAPVPWCCSTGICSKRARASSGSSMAVDLAAPTGILDSCVAVAAGT